MKTGIRTSLTILLMIASINTIRAAIQLSSNGVTNGPLQTIDTIPPSLAGKPFPVSPDTSYNYPDTKYQAAVDRLRQQAAILSIYLKVKNYNSTYCFLVDMSIPSGKKRLFIYNIKKDSIEFSALVTHGYRSFEYNCNDQLQFSNMPYSFKTSLGKYRIGKSYYGHFGLAYKLHGLDSTNDNAYERAIVIHAHKNVPNIETFPHRIMESTGCPVVSPLFLSILDKYIKNSKKPILMWVYNCNHRE